MAGANQAAVIDMNDIEEMEIMDTPDESRKRKDGEAGADPMKNIRENVTSYVWNEGRRRAQTAFKAYTNVDVLRPYFDVEPYEVLKRVARSFIPVSPAYREANRTKIPSELYGPAMICFTLVALLLFEMKSSGHHVQEGTLMGSALITCFGYWMGISALLWVVAYVCSTHIRPLQIMTLLGYGLSGHCVVVLLSTVFHTTHTHIFFYIVWALFGGLCTLRMISLFVSRTPGRTERFILASLVAIVHLLFLVYLHFAYHRIVEDLSEALSDRKVGQPVAVPHAGVGARKAIPEASALLRRPAVGVASTRSVAHHAVTRAVLTRLPRMGVTARAH